LLIPHHSCGKNRTGGGCGSRSPPDLRIFSVSKTNMKHVPLRHIVVEVSGEAQGGGGEMDAHEGVSGHYFVRTQQVIVTL